MVRSQDTGMIQLRDSFKMLVQARNRAGMSKIWRGGGSAAPGKRPEGEVGLGHGKHRQDNRGCVPEESRAGTPDPGEGGYVL